LLVEGSCSCVWSGSFELWPKRIYEVKTQRHLCPENFFFSFCLLLAIVYIKPHRYVITLDRCFSLQPPTLFAEAQEEEVSGFTFPANLWWVGIRFIRFIFWKPFPFGRRSLVTFRVLQTFHRILFPSSAHFSSYSF